MQVKTNTHTPAPILDGFTITMDANEGRNLLNALESNQIFFGLCEELRAGLGYKTFDFLIKEAIGEGHYDHDLLNGKRIAAIKRLRATMPGLGLKRAKDYMDARYNLLRFLTCGQEGGH